MKICALLVPKEFKVERTGGVKDLTDEELDQAIAAVKAMLAARTGETAKVIEGEAEVARPVWQREIGEPNRAPIILADCSALGPR